MIANQVSIILPSRNERFLPQTITDLLAHATGDVEVIAVLDGWWPDPPLRDDPRLVVLHKTDGEGMRPAINDAVRIARGEFLMKLDAHCLVAEGCDEVLKQECDDNWIVVPRRYSLDAERWCIQENGKSPVDAHFLSYPFQPDRAGVGLHGQVWNERARERKAILLDDEMSSQGSCWFMRRTHWDRLGELDVNSYGNFVQEFQELGNKTWLGGGAVKVNKKTFYAHLHKGKEYGRGYFISKQAMSLGAKFCVDHWMFDRWTERKHDLKYLIDKFWPVPGWPNDWERARFHEQYQG